MNYEVGSESGFAARSCWKFLTFSFLLLTLAACGHLTIAPAPVQTHAVAISEGQQTAGILGYDRTGLIVNDAWIKAYDAMLADYGKKLPASTRVPPGDRTGITRLARRSLGEGGWHVNFEVNDRYADLKYFERNATP